MKFENVTIGKPSQESDYLFVRGTSLQDALFILLNGYLSLELSPKRHHSEFDVYATKNCSSQALFAKDFHDVSDAIILQQAKEDAKERAKDDYLDHRYVDEMRVGDYFRFFEPTEYWATFGDDIKKDNLPKNSFMHHLKHAERLEGVIFYFNKKLLKHNLTLQPHESMRRNYHSVLVKPTREIKRSCLAGVEPLGPIEKNRLEEIVNLYGEKPFRNT